MDPALRQYVKDNLDMDLLDIRLAENKAQSFDLMIDTAHFLGHLPEFAEDLHKKPGKVMNLLKKAAEEELYGAQLSLDMRLANVPGLKTSKISDLGVEQRDALVRISGTVVRCGGAKSLATNKAFLCIACKETFRVEADLQLYGEITLPASCPGKQEGKVKTRRCRGSVFEESTELTLWKDYREVKVQESFGSVAPGRVPQSIWVLLAGNLANCCSPGDEVTVTGPLLLRWGSLQRDKPCDVQLCLQAFTVENDEDKVQRTSQEVEVCPGFGLEMLHCFASPLLGLDHIKLGLLLCAVGGVKEDVKGMKLRGHCHALIVGEPGTGKSSLLQSAAQLKARSVFTNALGTSKAGLTLSAVKEGGEWMLEAGALVLSDCGICCIDDFSLFPKEDRADIFEAMEHQTMSVAKAGMVCQVKTRTTVIAACRPVGGRIDSFKDLEENTGLSTPLLSRFDLVFILNDSREAELDEIRADFILNRMWTDSNPAALRSLVDQVKDLEVALSESVLSLIRTYYEYARLRLEQLTVRHLESLLRLVQAHAKLCGRLEACELDALSVLILMESTARGCGLVTCTSPDICFQSEELFADACEEVKARLGSLDSN